MSNSADTPSAAAPTAAEVARRISATRTGFFILSLRPHWASVAYSILRQIATGSRLWQDRGEVAGGLSSGPVPKSAITLRCGEGSPALPQRSSLGGPPPHLCD